MVGTVDANGVGLNAEVLAVCIVHAVKPDAGQVGRTAIDKRPVDGPVDFGTLGPVGDVQCDVENHGGPDQAVYAYAEDEAQRWAQQIGRDVPPGWFGENLRMRGMPTSDAVIGERWRIGDAVELEVTSPRIPCATFGRHVEQQRWVRRFSLRGDVGTYLRVRVTGPVSAGDPVHRHHIPEHGVTVREVFTAGCNGAADRDRLRLLLDGGDEIAASLRSLVEHVLTRG